MKSKTAGTGNYAGQKLKQSLHQIPSVTDDSHLQATILLARREACRKQNRKRISFTCFLRKQLPWIGWKLWSMQGIFLLSAYGLLASSSDYLRSPLRLAKLLFCLSVAVFMTALPLLYRPVRYQMHEIEATARFSSVKLLLAKLIAIGIGDVSLLTGIFFTALAKTSLSADGAVIYLSVPFLLTCSGCLFMLGHFPPRRFLVGSTLFCSVLILAASFLPGQYTLLFHPSFSAVQIPLCALLSAFCAYQLRYIIKTSSYEELQLT
ncbi:MAG: hypothetical protein K2K90_14020 [Lachnospiraceae bacterium]|nr:hypothetical protein [Lachnospiraceae bacterium]